VTCNHLEAVIWDMDGVLVDTYPFHFRAWAEVCRRRGCMLTPAAFKSNFGVHNELTVPRLLGIDPDESDLIRSIGEEKEALFRDLVRGGCALMSGVRDWLVALQSMGIQSAVATSAPRANLAALLGASDVLPYFAALVCAEDAPRSKPAPDLFLEAAARLKMPPERCLVIEDSLVGVEAARAAGMRCLAITGHRIADELCRADWVTHDLADLPPESLLRAGC
jgi:beta-phosphoglucomutase